MKIQLNTDKTVNSDESKQLHYLELIQQGMSRYQIHITRIEAHISDENGMKVGIDDVRCLLEARLKGRQPIAVSYQSDTVEDAVSGAIHRLGTSLKTIIGRIQNTNRS